VLDGPVPAVPKLIDAVRDLLRDEPTHVRLLEAASLTQSENGVARWADVLERHMLPFAESSRIHAT
jgi:hypothetical protein